MNYRDTINKGKSILLKNSIFTANLDAEILLSKTLNKSREEILLNQNQKINKNQMKNFIHLINRRKFKEPISVILEKKFFWKTQFIVNKNVLTPRFETELLVEALLKIYKQSNQINLLDIGVGTGCILISLLKEKKKWKGTGIDVSTMAINTAKTNAKIQQVDNRIRFINSDIDNFSLGKYDLIVTNPPYINKHKIKYLDDEVRIFEPKLALDGGIDGLSKIKNIILKSSKLIKRGGKLIIEIGFDQKFKVLEILKKNFFYVNKVVKDYSGKDRCIISTKL